MIHPKMIVSIIDPSVNDDARLSIDQLFQRYSHLSFEDGNNRSINFAALNVKIADWFGWADLLKITKISNEPVWNILQFKTPGGDGHIIVTKDERIMTYDPAISTRGKNGAPIYTPQLNILSELIQSGEIHKIFIRCRYDGDTLIAPGQFQHVDLVQSDDTTNHGYLIETSTGTYTANMTQVCGMNEFK